MIRLANPSRLYQDLYEPLSKAQEQVIHSNQVMLGECTTQLEEKIAERSSAKYCAIVGSGSDALAYGLVAAGVKQTTVPAQTFVATKNSCHRAGVDITWADVTSTGSLDWREVKGSAVWVGLFGNPSILDTSEPVYEDGAQHFGIPLQGVFASYSFDPTKTLANFGNGGAVVSNNEDIILGVKQLRRHGVVNDYVGGNSIMSERECAELLIKLDYYNAFLQRRRELCEYYTEHLGAYVPIITDPTGMISKFVIATEYKDQLRAHLLEHNIQSKDVYESPLADKPRASSNCKQFLSIPCDSHTTDKEATIVVNSIRDFYETRI